MIKNHPYLISTVALTLAIFLFQSCSNPLGTAFNQTPGFHPGFVAPSPTVISVLPRTGALQGGTTITITGTNFQNAATVRVGGNACLNVKIVSTTSITCVTPAHGTGYVAVEVKNPDLTTASLAAGYDYLGGSGSAAGFATVSGAGVSTGPGVKLRYTLGTVGNPVSQSGAGVKLNTGVQGTLPKP